MVKHRHDMSLLAQEKPLRQETVINITSREGLINALQEAIQVEHGLMLQYMYAAYSCKKFESEGLTLRQVEKVRDWESRVLKIARDEMAHLGTVCNLINSVGGTPDFNRRNFPQRADKWLPFEYELIRFSVKALQRFVRFESPENVEEPAILGVAPTPIEYDYVGELYRSIAAGFQTLDQISQQDRNYKLFIGSMATQDNSDWTGNLRIPLIRSVEDAVSAINFIVEQGEGTPGNVAGSHYGDFLSILDELQQEMQADPNFDPARPVLENPLTRLQRDAGDNYNLINADTLAHKVAELFNHLYSSLLLMLTQFYDPAGESLSQRIVLQNSARRTMSGIIRPLAEMLTVLNADDSHTVTAGAPFELYGNLQLSGDINVRFTIIQERLAIAEKEAFNLATTYSEELARMKFIAENISFLKNTILNLSN